MIRLFFAAFLPSLLAIITLPTLALSTGRPEMQQKRPPEPVAAEISIAAAAFNPATETVRPGETVRWANESERDHSIVADKGEFKSDTIKPGKSWSHKFEKAGTYKYHCALHPRAKGTVKVESAGG